MCKKKNLGFRLWLRIDIKWICLHSINSYIKIDQCLKMLLVMVIPAMLLCNKYNNKKHNNIPGNKLYNDASDSLLYWFIFVFVIYAHNDAYVIKCETVFLSIFWGWWLILQKNCSANARYKSMRTISFLCQTKKKLCKNYVQGLWGSDDHLSTVGMLVCTAMSRVIVCIPLPWGQRNFYRTRCGSQLISQSLL